MKAKPYVSFILSKSIEMLRAVDFKKTLLFLKKCYGASEFKFSWLWSFFRWRIITTRFGLQNQVHITLWRKSFKFMFSLTELTTFWIFFFATDTFACCGIPWNFWRNTNSFKTFIWITICPIFLKFILK